MRLYIDDAGNYGDADTLILFDTTTWVNRDFVMLDEAPQSEKRSVAVLIDTYHRQEQELLSKFGN